MFAEADDYRQSREYQQAIIALKQGFDKIYELNKHTCLNCAEMLRMEIIDSIENLKKDLYGMSRGIFKKKNRNNESIAFAEDTIIESENKTKEKAPVSDNKFYPEDEAGQFKSLEGEKQGVND